MIYPSFQFIYLLGVVQTVSVGDYIWITILCRNKDIMGDNAGATTQHKHTTQTV